MSVDLKLRQSQGPMFISIRSVIIQTQQHRTMKTKIAFWPERYSFWSKILHLITGILSSEFFLIPSEFCSFEMEVRTYAHICGLSCFTRVCTLACFLFLWLLSPLSTMFSFLIPVHPVYINLFVTFPQHPPLALFQSSSTNNLCGLLSLNLLWTKKSMPTSSFKKFPYSIKYTQFSMGLMEEILTIAQQMLASSNL